MLEKTFSCIGWFGNSMRIDRFVISLVEKENFYQAARRYFGRNFKKMWDFYNKLVINNLQRK